MLRRLDVQQVVCLPRLGQIIIQIVQINIKKHFNTILLCKSQRAAVGATIRAFFTAISHRIDQQKLQLLLQIP